MAHPASGFYTRNNLEYASQSTIIGETDPICDPSKEEGLEIWRNKCNAEGIDWEEIVQDSCDRGTILHHRIEKKLGFNVEPIEMPGEERLKDLRIEDYVKHAKGFIGLLAAKQKTSGGKAIVVEEVKFSDKFGFACTTDMNLRIGFKKKGWEYHFDGFDDAPYTVLDWKNVRPPGEGKEPKAKPRSHHKSNFIQLGANALAHNEMVRNGELDQPLITQGAICALYSWREPRFHVLSLKELTVEVLRFVERVKLYQDIHGKLPRPVQTG